MASIKVLTDVCTGCESCVSACPFGAIALNDDGVAQIGDTCTLCGSCVEACPFEAIELTKDEEKTVDLSMWQGIWVFCEIANGAMRGVGPELLGQARKLADELHTDVTALILGDAEIKDYAPELIARGADKVLAAVNPGLKELNDIAYTGVVYELVQKYHPEIILMGATGFGRSMAPRVAARLRTGLTADCTILSADTENHLLQQTRPAFGGNLMATIICPKHRPQIATVRPKVFAPLAADETRHGELIVENVNLPKDILIETLKTLNAEGEGVSIADADIIVAVGKGIGSAKNIALAEQLANLLGGAVAVTRPLVDLGWYGYTHQVGQTGKTVAPRLYIACGISGAIQHLAGIAAETVVAVNNDPDAPIFSHAHYAINCDCVDFLQTMVETIKDKGYKAV
ncbi:MAG: electron transfer flavoprotein subunit alpha [Firmicutes bacterium]|nr:electron transfer flavoprotein subunit alpha [Bacillota bacterium]